MLHLFGWSEVKLRGNEAVLDEAAARLVAVTDRIDISRRTPPAAHLLVTAFGAASYQRADGVTVAPLTARERSGTLPVGRFDVSGSTLRSMAGGDWAPDCCTEGGRVAFAGYRATVSQLVALIAEPGRLDVCPPVGAVHRPEVAKALYRAGLV